MHVGLAQYCKEVREARYRCAQIGFWTFLLIKVLLDTFASSIYWQREDVLSQLVWTIFYSRVVKRTYRSKASCKNQNI